MTLMSASCGKIQETELMFPITFKAEAGVSLMTKAGGTPLADFSISSFTVTGTEIVGENETPIFGNGQTVTGRNGQFFQDNSQPKKNWNFNADRYKFSAFTAGTASGSTLTVEGASTGGNIFIAFEKDNAVEKGKFGQPVDLQFSRLLSRIRVAFFEDIEENSVKDVNFSLSGTFIKEGNYSVNLSNGVFTATPSDSESNFEGSLSGTIGTDSEPMTYSDFVEVLPYHNPSPITLTISYTLVDLEGNEYPPINSSIPITRPADVAWDLNHSYTYIVRISDSVVTLDATIDLNIHDWMDMDPNETILE